MQIKHKILFFPEKEQGKPDGKIRMRVRWNNNIAQFNVGYRVNIDKWVAASQRCKNNTTHGKNSIPASTINRAIQHYEDMAEEVFYHFEQTNTIPTAEEFKTIFNAKLGKTSAQSKSLFDCYNEFIISEAKEKGWTYATTQKHRTVKTHLYNFSSKLQFSDLTEKGLSQFIDYLLNLTDNDGNLNMKNTTIKKDYAILTWFLKWATEKGYNKELAFVGYKPKLKTVQKKIIYLEWEELMRMYQLTGLKENEQLANDRFLFSCFTSLRFSDVEELRWDNVHNNYIELTTIKTNDCIRIELNNYSRAILSRYPRTTGKVFPHMFNQKANNYLKRVAQIAGINTPITTTYFRGGQRINEVKPKYELITTHCGRRTFICNALMLGIAPNIVMKWTGHSNYNAMRPYIEIADSAKQSAMSLFNKI